MYSPCVSVVLKRGFFRYFTAHTFKILLSSPLLILISQLEGLSPPLFPPGFGSSFLPRAGILWKMRILVFPNSLRRMTYFFFQHFCQSIHLDCFGLLYIWRINTPNRHSGFPVAGLSFRGITVFSFAYDTMDFGQRT